MNKKLMKNISESKETDTLSDILSKKQYTYSSPSKSEDK